ncbi:hypothetical protein [Rickettsiella massiliensis]|uniref:hypothetical protein n=1 Tax=Rickettsiella massiliensis TaxID=676517 RepID=UPI000494ED50|nr:hypothetical protein [Rickettsiella massiliensis]
MPDSQKLLKEACNSLIIVDQDSKNKLQNLIKSGKPVYFISNSNYLNIDKIVSEFNNLLTENWKLPAEKDIKGDNFRPIEITKNLYMPYPFKVLCSSRVLMA